MIYVRWIAILASALGLAACGGQSVTTNGGGDNPPPPPATYTLGGTISGLVANGLVLTSNGQSVTVNSGTSTFTFPTSLTTGTAYAVNVQTTPNGLTCSVANGAGNIGTANVSNVVVTCSDKAYTLGGSITGLTTAGLILGNGTDQLTVAANATSFTMSKAVAFTSSYQVQVVAQPQGLTCSVQNGTGTMGAADVTNIAVSCSNQLFTIGGTVSGLTVAGLVLANNSGDPLNVPANAATFTFATSLAFGSTYSVSVTSQPAGLTCSVSAGSGNVPAADVTSVQIVCSNLSYFLGGSVSGLAYSGLVLSDGTDSLPVPMGAIGFTMPTKLAFMSHYTVSVATQPTNGLCSVSGATGTMPAGDVTSVSVTCADRLYTLGGPISGLTSTGLILANGTDRLSVAANAAQFSMPTGLAIGSSYNVTIVSQPPGLTCTVTHGSGTMPGNDFSGVQVSCTARLWTWEKGSNVVTFAPGVYGAPGVPDANNLPGSRDNQATWRDSSGKFWLFGGNGVDSTGATGELNDMWSYDPVSSTWTYWTGSNQADDPGSYGSKGVPVSGNQPPARHGATTWADSTGNLWMFGGATASNVFFNDVWKFDTASKLWTWVAGPNTQTATDVSSMYGTQGIPDPANRPHARGNAVSWVDGSGHFWMLGGLYVDTATIPNVNDTFSDLWSFDTTNKEWTWVSGSNAMNDAGHYGSQGLGDVANSPPTRFGAVSWLEASTGKLWLFGGGNLVGGAANALNDVWTYNPADGKWTWVTGSSTPNSLGTYGTLGIAAAGNQPGARGGATAWADAQGHFWMFGGAGLDVGPPTGTAVSLNDLWSLDPTTGQWTWVGGAQTGNQGGVYGNPGVTASGHFPGARSAAAGWLGTDGSLWLFGGTGYDSATPTPAFGDLNDVWKF